MEITVNCPNREQNILAAIVRNVTERKKAEKALKKEPRHPGARTGDRPHRELGLEPEGQHNAMVR